MRFLAFFLLILALPIPLNPAAQTGDAVLVSNGTRQVDSAPLDAVAFSPDGAYVASGGRDNRIRLWYGDIAAVDEPLLVLEGHTGRITGLAFSPDGALLASSSADFSVRVWDLAALLQAGETLSDNPLQTLTHHRDIATGVAFSPDGLLLASGSRDATLWLGDPRSGRQFALLENFGGPVWALAFRPGVPDYTLASAGEDGVIWLWGLGDEPSLVPLNGHLGPVMSLSFDRVGNRLVSGGMDGLIRLWTIGNELDEPLILRGHLAPVTGVAFTPDAEMVVSASLDGSVRAWDAVSGEALLAEPGNHLPLTALAAHGSALASVGTEGVMHLWTADEALVVAARRGSTVTVANPNPATPAPPVAETGTTISIPVAGINSPITEFPLDGTSWAISPWERLVGYLQGTAWIDQNGNTVLGGHSRYPNGQPGVFARLYNVSVGDVIILVEDGVEYRYVVVEIRVVRYDDLSVIYPSSHSRLTLITCDVPSFDAVTNEYYERLVVIADRVG